MVLCFWKHLLMMRGDLPPVLVAQLCIMACECVVLQCCAAIYLKKRKFLNIVVVQCLTKKVESIALAYCYTLTRWLGGLYHPSRELRF